MFNIHYTVRNKLLHRFKLWGVTLFFARRRLSKNRNCPNAKKWADICKKSYDKQDIRKDILSIFFNESCAYSAVFDSLKKSDFSCTHIKEELQKLEYSQKGMFLVLSILGYLNIDDSNYNIEISYCRYLLYKHYYNQPIKAAFELCSHSYPKEFPESNNILFTCKGHDLQEIKVNILTQDINHKENICIVSDTIEALSEMIVNLPNNINIDAYIMDNCTQQSFSCKKSNISLKIHSFSQGIFPLGSHLEEKAINSSENISSEFTDLFLSHMEKMDEYKEMDIISSPLKLKMEDTILITLKKLIGANHLAEKYKNIFISLDQFEKSKEVLQYLLLLNNKKNDNNLFFIKREHLLKDDFSHEDIKKWFVDHIRSVLIASSSKDKNLSLETSISEYENFKLFLKEEKSSYKINDIISYLGTVNPSYRRAADILSKNYENINQKMTIFSHFPSGYNIEKILDNGKGIYKHDIIDVSNRKDISKKYSDYTSWVEYIFDEAFDYSVDKKLFMVANLDISAIIAPKIKAFMVSNVPYLMFTVEILSKAIKESSPLYGLICPGRNYFSWLLTHILQKNNIKVIDLQILFQSEYSRYKASPADIFAMINEEQRGLYLKGFGLNNNQDISIVGPLLFNDAIKKIESLDPLRLKQKLKISEGDKVILFATQYLNIKECLSEIEAIFKIIKSYSGYNFIIKLHPKEPEENFEVYKKLIQEYQLCEFVTVISNHHDTCDIISISDLVITLFSNVGMEASLFKKYTWSINTTHAEYPCDITQDGLVVNIDSINKLEDYIYDLFHDQKHMNFLLEKQRSFFEKKPEASDGRVFDRIVKLMKS